MAGFYGRTPRSSQTSVPRRNLMTKSNVDVEAPGDSASDSAPRVAEHGLSEIRSMISKGFAEIQDPLNKLQDKVANIETEMELLKQKIDEKEVVVQTNDASKSKRLPKVLTVGRLSHGICIVIMYPLLTGSSKEIA